MLTAKIIRKSIKRWPDKLVTVNREFLPTAAVIVQSNAQRNVKVKSGTLRASIKHKVTRDKAIIGSNLNYAAHVEYGTKPHTISVKNAKVLTNGKSFFGKSVQHPGTRAQPFLRPALDKNRKGLVNLWRSIFRRVYGR